VRQRQDVHEHPQQRGQKAAGVQPPSLQNRVVLADDRRVAFVEIAEWVTRPFFRFFGRLLSMRLIGLSLTASILKRDVSLALGRLQ
jgi:hypothetical protein